MKLGNDNPLDTVNHERTIVGHEWNLAHVYFLFFNVFYRLRAGVFVHIKYDQTQRHLQRRAVGHVTLLTFLDIIFWLFKIIADKFKHTGLVEILDRKDRLKDTLYTFTIHRDRLISGRQEQFIGRLLHFNQIGHLQDFTDFAIIFADAFLAEEGRCHRGHNSVSITDRSGWGEPLSDQIWIVPFQCLRRCPNAPPETENNPVKAGWFPL